MIDFSKLKKLHASAKAAHLGKPLDNVRGLSSGVGYRGDNMRNCRLFKVNDTNWRVTLHDNTIAKITEIDDGCAQITVHNVSTWPTNTTASRLSSVLGIAVWKHQNKLRAHLKNCNTTRTATQPPLVDGLMFHSGPAGVVCMNPELITEQRTRVLKEPSKPVLAYLRKVKALATTMIRVGAVSYSDLAERNKEPEPSIDVEPDAETVFWVVSAGACRILGSWQVYKKAQVGEVLRQDSALRFLKSGLDKLKDSMYSKHGVYETCTFSFADQFEEVRHVGQKPSLAQAA